MKRGEIIEIGPSVDIFNAPRDPYTKALIDAIPGRETTFGTRQLAAVAMN